MNLQFKKINFGIASRQGDTIFFNSRLEAYPELHLAIINHEIAHTSGFRLKDLVMDLKNTHLKGLQGQYWKFVLRNPSSWSEFLPFWMYKGKLLINPTLLMFWGIILFIMGGLAWAWIGV